MSDLKFNEDEEDLDVTAGALSLTSEKDAIRQRIAFKLRLVVGEWFLDTTKGTDYFGSIFGKKSFVEIDSEFTRAILTVEGVTKLVAPISYKLNTTTRVLETSFEVETDDGPLLMNESLSIQ